MAQLKTLVDKLGTSPLSEVPPNMINQQQYIIRECGNIQSEQLRTKTQIEKFSHLIIVFLEGLQKVVDYAPPTETNTTVLTMKQMLNELVAKVSNELVASSNIVI